MSLGRLSTALLLGFMCAACSKKPEKPMRTAPWPAHAPPVSSGTPDAGTARQRYRIDAPSRIDFEVPSSEGAIRGSVPGVSGEVALTPSDLSQSSARIDADLGSLRLDSGSASDPNLLARVRSALGMTGTEPAPRTRFELSALDAIEPAQLTPNPADGSADLVRRVRAVAIGSLLLHGFRVQRRMAIEAEFGFLAGHAAPDRVSIRSRSPLVVSFETHGIVAPALEVRSKRAAAPHQALVTIELHGTKID